MFNIVKDLSKLLKDLSKSGSKYIRKNQLLSLLVIVVLVLFISNYSGLLEGFSTCYVTRKVQLKDVSGGLSEGLVTFETNKGRLYISFQGNLPYHKGGVFNTVNGDYFASLINKKDPKAEVIPVGVLLRYPDRVYRLKNELLGDYSEYTHFVVTRKTEDYKDVVVLEGTL